MNKLFKWILMFVIYAIGQLAFAVNTKLDAADYFKGKTGCFMIYDTSKNVVVYKYNDNNCAKQLPPQSTFKVALSLMGFDSKVITESTVFKWDGKKRDIDSWNKNQTPQSWLQNSVLWVSQVVAPEVGIKEINNYLKEFNYGNKDFSGDPGRNNALKRAWLNSSLKISANEQAMFLTNMVNKKLPISAYAIDNTMNNMYLQNIDNGWKLYGKTGSGVIGRGFDPAAINRLGWFVGFIEKDGRKYVFVSNYVDNKPKDVMTGGADAKAIAIKLLNDFVAEHS